MQSFFVKAPTLYYYYCYNLTQVIRSLRLICDDQTEWAEKATPVLMSYRATVETPLGISTFHVLYGREMNTGIDIQLLQELEKSPDLQTHTANLVPKLKMTHETRDRSNSIKGRIVLLNIPNAGTPGHAQNCPFHWGIRTPI